MLLYFIYHKVSKRISFHAGPGAAGWGGRPLLPVPGWLGRVCRQGAAEEPLAGGPAWRQAAMQIRRLQPDSHTCNQSGLKPVWLHKIKWSARGIFRAHGMAEGGRAVRSN